MSRDPSLGRFRLRDALRACAQRAGERLEQTRERRGERGGRIDAQVIELAGGPAQRAAQTVDLTGPGLAEIAPDDPEPEYADINHENQAVVSLQENNHLVIVDLPTLTVVQGDRRSRR